MEFTRNIRRYLVGDDVKCVKDRLLDLGYLHASTTRKFGNDSYKAAKAFQTAKGLQADGIVGPLTLAALFAEIEAAAPAAAAGVPGHFSAAVQAALGAALAGVSPVRREICLDALNYAIDPYDPPRYPRSLYIRGGNLYNQNLRPNVITLARIAAGAKAQPEYYDGGRRQLMEAAVQSNPSITGADCSGGIVGLLRHAKVVSAGFDANANTLAGARHAAPVAKAALKAGDWVHRDGHIGLYAGGGYVVEWIGGEYGCQLTKLADRRCYSFLTGKVARMGAWTGFFDPTYY